MKYLIAFVFLSLLLAAGSLQAQQQTDNQTSPPEGPQQGWYLQNSGDIKPFNNIHALNRDTAWADYLYTKNGGITWESYQNGRNVIQFIDRLHGWSYSPTKAGWISITTNGGQTWDDYDSHALGAFYFMTPLIGFASDFGSYIYRTVDGGKTWKTNTTDFGKIVQFAAFDSLTIMATGGNYPDPDIAHQYIAGIFLSTDGGESWKYRPKSKITSGAFSRIAILDSTTVIGTGLVTFTGRSTDRGYTWKGVSLDGDTISRHIISDISASDKNNVTAVGKGGESLIFRSTDGGITWKRQNSNTKEALYTVWMTDSSTGWAAGDNGVIIHTTNGGFAEVQSQHSILPNAEVHPNPSNSELTLTYSLPEAQHVNINIFDISGHILLSPVTNLFQPQGVQSILIDTHILPSGMYMLRITTEQYLSILNCSVTH